MATTFTQGFKHNVPAPPPYTVQPTGSNVLAITETGRGRNESPQGIIVRGKSETKFLTLMQIGSIVILVLCALSCILALHRNTKIMEQNLQLLDRQLQLLAENKKYAAFNVIKNDRFKRMAHEMDSCPPCPTEAPTNPIQPHKNPVSVLNEEVGKNAQYEIRYECEDPHIHTATLRIVEDPSFQGKSWTGKGNSRQNAKQAAAWEAIQKDLQHLVQHVADEYKPPVYNPPCRQPPTNKQV